MTNTYGRILSQTIALFAGCICCASSFEATAWNAMRAGGTSVFSPVGAECALSLLGCGLETYDRAAVAEAINVRTDFGNAFRAVLDDYALANASNRVSILVSPSIWLRSYRSSDAFKPDWVTSIQRGFGAEAGFIRQTHAADDLTQARTANHVRDALGPVPPNAVGALVVGVAFEGAWAQPFDERLTSDRPFVRADGKTEKLPMMRNDYARATVVEMGSYTATLVPFAVRNVTMVLILPKEGVSNAVVRRQLAASDSSLDELKRAFRAKRGDGVSVGPVTLHLPRFEIATRHDMSALLDIHKIPRTGYVRIADGFKLDVMAQKTWIRVDERGHSLDLDWEAPAPAKSSKKSRKTADDEDDSPYFRPAVARTFDFNRPFIFLVWEANSDTLVAAGEFCGN